MKIPCDIIRDILPLYAEDMVSNATKNMVEEHLTDCEACSAELENLRKPAKMPAEISTDSFKRVGDAIRRRRILAVMAVFLFIATVIVGGALMLDATIYLSAGEAVEDIYVDSDGVKILWDDQVIGTSAKVDTEDPGNYAVTAWTNLYKILFPTARVPYEQLSAEIKTQISQEQYAAFDNSSFYALEHPSETNFIYVDPSEHSMTLVLNADQPFPDGPMMDVDSDAAYFVFGLGFLTVVCFLFGTMNRNRWYGELAGRLAVVAGSLAISTVIVTAGQLYGLEGDFQEALIDSSAVALPMTLFGLCVLQLLKLNRQDKGL